MPAIARTLKDFLFQRRVKDLPPASKYQPLIDKIRASHLTYCGYPKLENLQESIQRVTDRCTPGIFLEAGVALGGSAILLATAKPASTPLYLYDIFGMIPPPSTNDAKDAHKRYAVIERGQSEGLGGNRYYGYVDNLQDVVRQNLRTFGVDIDGCQVHLVAGLFEETLFPPEKVAFAHIDCDWYDSVTICLRRIGPLLSVGGEMVFDDYSSYAGCKHAVDKFLADNDSLKLIKVHRSATIRKVA